MVGKEIWITNFENKNNLVEVTKEYYIQIFLDKVEEIFSFNEDDEIEEILSLADNITFNSFSQWERFKLKTQKANVSAGIRVNPESSTVETDLYNPCGRYSRLGVTLKEFKPDLLDGIEGLHFHALCEQNADALESVLQEFEKKFSKWIPQMKWINFGGGHHITRKDYDVEKLASKVKKIIANDSMYRNVNAINMLR